MCAVKRPGAFRESLPVSSGLLLLAAAAWLVWPPLAVVPLLLLAVNLLFFRDPERMVVADARAIVAAADGKVVEISRVTENHFCGVEMTRVAIFMSVLDVHVQRAPIAGEVALVRHYKGRFHDARRPEAALANEYGVIGIRDGDFKVVVRQIAGLIARRIVQWCGEGEPVAKGQRLGMIRYGSRVEVYLPLDVELCVAVGQRVKGGETVIGYRK